MLVLDIETTGLPQTKGFGNYYNPKEINKYNSSRIVSIALLNDNMEKYSIIKPNDFTIKNSHFHGITQENAVKNGISLKDFFNPSILQEIENSDIILGHNIDFDINVLLSELYRNELYGIYYLLEKKNRKCSYSRHRSRHLGSSHERLASALKETAWVLNAALLDYPTLVNPHFLMH